MELPDLFIKGVYIDESVDFTGNCGLELPTKYPKLGVAGVPVELVFHLYFLTSYCIIGKIWTNMV